MSNAKVGSNLLLCSYTNSIRQHMLVVQETAWMANIGSSPERRFEDSQDSSRDMLV